MSSEPTAYPQPHQDADNAPLLQGWRDGKLMIQRCADCGHVVFYPRPMCPACWSERLDWSEATGRGTIVSFSLVYRPNDPAFLAEVPIILAEVRLDEGALMLARIVAADPAGIRSTMKVRLLDPPEARRYPLPTFRPAEDAP